MSLRTVFRFALAAMIAAILTGPISAQTPNPWRIAPCPEAPMPRVKQRHGELRLGLQFGGPQVVQVQYELRIDGEPAIAPMPRARPRIIINAEEEIFQLEEAVPASRSAAVVPFPCTPHGVVGTIELGRCGPMNDSRGQWVFQSCPTCTSPVFRAAPVVMPPTCVGGYPHPLHSFTLVRGEPAGGWWLEEVRVPQPKHAPREVGSCPSCMMQTVQIHRCQEVVPVGPHGTAIAAPCCEKASGLAGTWYREMEGMVLAATIHGDEIVLRMSQQVDHATLCVTMTAECTVTKDGLLHGVITGVDVDVKRDPRSADTSSLAAETAQMAAELQGLVDAPFAFRFKQTSGGLMVTNLRVAGEGMSKQELAVVCGMYKSAVDGKVPTPRPMKTSAVGVSRCDGPTCLAPAAACAPPVAVEVHACAGPVASAGCQPPPPPMPVRVMPLPTPPGVVVPVGVSSPNSYMPVPQDCIYSGTILPGGQPVPCPPQGLPPLPSPACLPGCGMAMPPATVPGCGSAMAQPCNSGWNPPRPAGVPVGEFSMVAEAFGQMLCPQPTAYTAYPTGMFVPPPPPVSAPRMMTVPNRTLEGRWVRDVGPRVYVVKVAPDHMTLSFRDSLETPEGSTASCETTITVDYRISRDGTTAVGLISSADFHIDGPMSADDAKELHEAIAKMQQACEGKPFAMTIRSYGDALVIGNVRMPKLLDLADGGESEARFAGRYTNAGDKLLPKAVKVNDLPRCPPVAQTMPPLYPVVNGPVPTGAYIPPQVVGGILTTEYSNNPYPLANSVPAPIAGLVVGLPPQPMQFPPPPVESPRVKPGKRQPMPTAPVPIGNR